MSSVDGLGEVRRRILGNARAAEKERLRNLAIRELGPGATAADVEARAAELQREKLSAAGRKGRELQAQRLAEADRVRSVLPDLEELLQVALETVRLAKEPA